MKFWIWIRFWVVHGKIFAGIKCLHGAGGLACLLSFATNISGASRSTKPFASSDGHPRYTAGILGSVYSGWIVKIPLITSL